MRTYSLESTGVIVTELMKGLFDIELQWWRPKEPSYIPEYMLKVIGLARGKAFDLNETNLRILSALNGGRITVY